MSPTPETPDDVLHIRTTPLARTQREGLLSLGVVVSHLTPNAAEEALQDPNECDAMQRRIANATLCVIDEGTGLGTAATILGLRQTGPGKTYITLQSVSDVAAGLIRSQRLLGVPQVSCAYIHKGDLLKTLRALASPTPSAPVAAEALPAGHIRPPRPTIYIEDQEAYSIQELASRTPEWRLHRVKNGRLPARALLDHPRDHGEITRRMSFEALTLLIKHLPSDELGLMDTPEVGEWWEHLAGHIPPNMDLNGRHPRTSQAWKSVERVIWEALARDGGTRTLARLPASLGEMRAITEADWPRAVASARSTMESECLSPTGYSRSNVAGKWAIDEWDVVPGEDPLAPDADPHLYRPTLTTFRVARRYRSAPEVVQEAKERWGARPYHEVAAAEQLQEFVIESPPRNAEELAGWMRLLAALPDGNMKNNLEAGIYQWPLLEVEVLKLLTPAKHNFEWTKNQVACFTENGEPRDDILKPIELSDHGEWLWAPVQTQRELFRRAQKNAGAVGEAEEPQRPRTNRPPPHPGMV